MVEGNLCEEILNSNIVLFVTDQQDVPEIQELKLHEEFELSYQMSQSVTLPLSYLIVIIFQDDQFNSIRTKSYRKT